MGLGVSKKWRWLQQERRRKRLVTAAFPRKIVVAEIAEWVRGSFLQEVFAISIVIVINVCHEAKLGNMCFWDYGGMRPDEKAGS